MGVYAARRGICFSCLRRGSGVQVDAPGVQVAEHIRLGGGKALYHAYAAKMPIADYHCHIDPKDIWEDRRFENITQIWLRGRPLQVAADARDGL